ncbi:craniofacial development protein 2-like [Amphiura filiformis]|uniref:craniofacial development protein 2-like n=1 Tax=Amphiura filiformis TaxID=82378 RepID=UPI003B21D284
MEENAKGGREAQGHNGRNHQRPGDCRLPMNRDPRVTSADDVTQPKPKGTPIVGNCVIDKGHKDGQTTLNICTYNTRTLKTDESLESLLDELQNFKWDIIGLCETKREGEGVVELQGGAWLYNQGKTEDNKDAKGIGFLIHPKFKDFVKGMKCHSNRVISVTVQLTGNKQLRIVQVYAPTSEYDDEAVEEVYEEIAKAIEESEAEYTIVMGDFNAKIGSYQPGEESIMGKFGIGERNDRGDMLLEFAAQQGLVIANTYFKKRTK